MKAGLDQYVPGQVFVSPCSLEFSPLGARAGVHMPKQLVVFPPQNIAALAAAFPNLRQFLVRPESFEFQVVALECSFMSQTMFPFLKGVACYCHNTWLELRNLPASCYGTVQSLPDLDL